MGYEEDYFDNLEKFLEVIEDGSFTYEEMAAVGIDREIFSRMAHEHGYTNKFIYNTDETTVKMSFSQEVCERERYKKWGYTSVDSPEDIEAATLQQEVNGFVEGIKSGELESLPLLMDDFTEEQKQALIDTYIEKNQDLISIINMSLDERDNAMNDLEDTMNEMTGGKFSEYMDAHSPGGKNADNVDYYDDLIASYKQNPEFKELFDHYHDILYAEDGRGHVQDFIRQIQEHRPSFFEDMDINTEPKVPLVLQTPGLG